VPAEPSSGSPPLIELTHANPLQETEAPHLLAYLATISDPRGRHGRRHPLVAILAMGVLCRAGPVSLAAALRFHSRDPR
jgi:hypothetical protein